MTQGPEQRGQFYFEIKGNEFVNNGKLIWIVDKGSHKFLKNLGYFLLTTVITTIGGFSGAIDVAALMNIPPERLVYGSAELDAHAGLIAAGLVAGFGLGMFGLLAAQDILEKHKSVPSYQLSFG